VCTDCRKLLAAKIAGRTEPDLPRPQLGEREIEVIVAWLIHGTKEAAARELHIELSTVKTTIQRARLKYEAISRPAPTQMGLLVRLLQDGLIDMTELLDLDLRPHRG
jgi:DNA-binding CsgD family transcriptional regulator